MIADIFGQSFKDELFRELVNLHKEAYRQAKKEVNNETEWVTIEQLQRKTGWGRTTLEKWRDQGKFRYSQKTERGKCLYDLDDVNRFLRQNSKGKR